MIPSGTARFRCGFLMVQKYALCRQLICYSTAVCTMIFLHPATFSPSVFTDYQRFRFTYYWRFWVRSVPLNDSWLQEIRAFACFLRVRWGLPKLWLVFVIAPLRAARRIYRKYFFSAGRARTAATLGLTT